MTRSTLIAFVIVSSLFTGCYMSHERPNDAEVEVPPPAPTCTPVSSDPIARYEVLMADDVEIEAGTRRAEILSVSLRGLAPHGDLEFAEYLYRFEAVMGSLTTPDGGAVFTNARLRVSGRASLFGPYDIVATGEEVVEGEFWDANILRAGDEVVLTLEVDIAEGVEGVYEVRLGDECDLTSRMWTVPEDGPTVEMSSDLIDDESITVIVTVVPST